MLRLHLSPVFILMVFQRLIILSVSAAEHRQSLDANTANNLFVHGTHTGDIPDPQHQGDAADPVHQKDIGYYAYPRHRGFPRPRYQADVDEVPDPLNQDDSDNVLDSKDQEDIGDVADPLYQDDAGDVLGPTVHPDVENTGDVDQDLPVTFCASQFDNTTDNIPPVAAEFLNATILLNISQVETLMNSLYDKFFDTEMYHRQLELLRHSISCLGESEVSDQLRSMFAGLEEKLSRWLFARRYVDRVMYTLIFVVGMIGNITLIIIFARHEEVRTVPNMIILSIAISDSLSLVGILPVYYLTISIGAESFMKISSCYYYAFYRVTLMSVTELSVATLSIQRLLATKVLQKEHSIFLLMTTSRKVVGFAILAIWITSMLVTAPVFFVFEFVDGTCFPYIIQTPIHKACLVFYIVFFVAFPFPIVYLSGLTAWRLSKISRVPARTALVITILAIFYLLVYIPRAAWYGYASWVHTNRHDPTFLYIDVILSYLHFMDSCLNPVALFIASRSFRKLFIHYLCSCGCMRPKTHQLQINTSSGPCTTSQV